MDPEQLNKIYRYFLQGGIKNIVIKKVNNFIVICVLTALLTFLMSCVDYSQLFITNKLSESIHVKISSLNILLFVIFSIFTILHIYVFINELRESLKIKRLFDQCGIIIEDNNWQDIIFLLNRNVIIKEDLYVIARKLMIKDNYLIAMYNLGILDTYSRVFEWYLDYSIFNYIFSKTNGDSHTLERRIRLTGIIGLIVSPFVFVFLIGYYLIKYTYEYKSNPGSIGQKNWTKKADYILRDFNEYIHNFEYRKKIVYSLAVEYTDQFKNTVLITIANSISLISGAIVVIILAASLINDTILLDIDLFHGKSGVYFISIFGGVFAVCKSIIGNNNSFKDPSEIMANIITITHYCPDSWKHKFHTHYVKTEFTQFFQYKIVIFLNELLSVFIVPIKFLFLDTSKIIEFINNSTIYDKELSLNVCKYSIFTVEKENPLIDSKMEQSQLNFQSILGTKTIKNSDYYLVKPFGELVDERSKLI